MRFAKLPSDHYKVCQQKPVKRENNTLSKMMTLRYCQFLLIIGFYTILFSRGIEAVPGFVQSSGFVKVDEFEEVTVFWELVDVQVREDVPMERRFSVGGRGVLYYDQSNAIPTKDLDISYIGNNSFIGFSINNNSLDFAGTCGSSIDLGFVGGLVLTDSTPVLYVQTRPMTPTIDIPYNPIAEGATTIICTADSLSMPEGSRQDVNMIYSWRIIPPKEYLVLQNNTNNQINGTIIVEDLKINETLEIKCTASEDGSSFEAVNRQKLRPYYAPGAVVAVSNNVTAIVGEKFILQVTSEDKGYPEGNYTWQLPDGTVQKQESNQLNLIWNLTSSGNFTCYLENVVGVGDSATILVTFIEIDAQEDKCKWWCILIIVLVVVSVVVIIICCCCCWHYKVACFAHKSSAQIDVNQKQETNGFGMENKAY